MTNRLCEFDPFHTGYFLKEGAYYFILCFIEAAIGQKGRYADLVDLINDAPMCKRASNMEFRWPVPWNIR